METKIEINDNITALQFFTKYNEQNVTGMLELFTNDAQITFLPLGENGIGKVSELGNSIWSQLVDCFPGISNKILKTKYDSEGNLICEITFAGNQKKDFPGIPNKGQSFETDHIFIFRFNEKGLINSLSVSWDHQDLCRQLGS